MFELHQMALFDHNISHISRVINGCLIFEFEFYEYVY